MYRIIAFDPGGTTGWATYTAERVQQPDGKMYYFNSTWACGQLGPDEHHVALHTLLEIQTTLDFDIVYESFEFRNAARPGLVLVSREYIGVIKFFYHDRVNTHGWNLVKQDPAQAVGDKSFVQDRHVKKMDLWRPGQRHAMDATRHLLYYMAITLKRVDLIKAMGK